LCPQAGLALCQRVLEQGALLESHGSGLGPALLPGPSDQPMAKVAGRSAATFRGERIDTVVGMVHGGVDGRVVQNGPVAHLGGRRFLP
jgi:hypothetical protein